MFDNEKFGKAIADSGMRLRDISAATRKSDPEGIGVGKSTVSAWVNGTRTNPGSRELMLVCRAMGRRAYSFFRFKN